MPIINTMKSIVLKSGIIAIVPICLAAGIGVLYVNSNSENKVKTNLKSGIISGSIYKVLSKKNLPETLGISPSLEELKYLSTIDDEKKRSVFRGLLLISNQSQLSESKLDEYTNNFKNEILASPAESFNALNELYNDEFISINEDFKLGILYSLKIVDGFDNEKAVLAKAELDKDLHLNDSDAEEVIISKLMVKQNAYELLITSIPKNEIIPLTEKLIQDQSNQDMVMAIKSSLYNNFPEYAEQMNITAEDFNLSISTLKNR